jgi:hypothetical protein
VLPDRERADDLTGFRGEQGVVKLGCEAQAGHPAPVRSREGLGLNDLEVQRAQSGLERSG